MFKRVLYIPLAISFILSVFSYTQASAAEIRFAFQDRIGSVIPIVAVANGYFKDEGLNVKPLTFSSGPACAEALYSGAADIGAMGDTTAIITVSRTERFRIIASHATGEHRHRVMVQKNSSFTNLADLKGKRLAVKKGTSTYGGLLAALKKQGILPYEFQIIDLSPSVMNDALAAGSIDAFAASEPTPSLKEGSLFKELSTFGGLGNEYPIMILADHNCFKDRAEDMEAFLKALKRAEKFIGKNPDEVIRIMSQETGLSPEAAKRAVKRHQYSLRLDDGIIISLEDTAHFLCSEKIIRNVPDFREVSDFSYLEKIN